MKKDPNTPESPAFPMIERFSKDIGTITGQSGMTLRAYISTELLPSVMLAKSNLQPMKQVRFAIRMADSLIKELNKLSSKDESSSKV